MKLFIPVTAAPLRSVTVPVVEIAFVKATDLEIAKLCVYAALLRLTVPPLPFTLFVPTPSMSCVYTAQSAIPSAV